MRWRLNQQPCNILFTTAINLKAYKSIFIVPTTRISIVDKWNWGREPKIPSRKLLFLLFPTCDNRLGRILSQQLTPGNKLDLLLFASILGNTPSPHLYLDLVTSTNISLGLTQIPFPLPSHLKETLNAENTHPNKSLSMNYLLRNNNIIYSHYLCLG